MRSIAIYGGTFDPVHLGHINLAVAVESFFNFDEFLFLPCKLPVIKQPSLANAKQRVEMLHLALTDYPQFAIELCEIEREKPSYMVETLKHLRIKYPGASLTLLLGNDAFQGLEQWHHWSELLLLTNLLILERPGYALTNLSSGLDDLLKKHLTPDPLALKLAQAGKIALYNAGLYPIESRLIREKISRGEDVSAEVPLSVLQMIKRERLYL